MPERAREFLEELREHWDDVYWWADHPTLRTILVCGVAAIVGLIAEYGKLRMQRTMIQGAAPA